MFFSHGFNTEKSKALFCVAKDRIPNAFTLTAFKKHYIMIVDERHTKEKSDLIYYLLSIVDRKESINQYRDNIILNPIDCRYENLFIKSKRILSTPFGFK